MEAPVHPEAAQAMERPSRSGGSIVALWARGRSPATIAALLDLPVDQVEDVLLAALVDFP
jgi:hypothetical protein